MEITKFSERDDEVIEIDATIYCEKNSHKAVSYTQLARRKPGGDRAGLACLLSMAACAGALFLQVLYNKHLVELQDWSALMDTSGAVAWVSVLLLAVTLILDLFCLWAEGKLNGEERGPVSYTHLDVYKRQSGE